MMLVHKEKNAVETQPTDRNAYYEPQGHSTKELKERVMHKQEEAMHNNGLFYE